MTASNQPGQLGRAIFREKSSVSGNEPVGDSFASPARRSAWKAPLTKKHRDYLEPAGFILESSRYRVEHAWTTDEIIGYLYSTSFANRALFGDRH